MKIYEHFEVNPKIIAFAMACNFFGNNKIRKSIDFLIKNKFNAGIWSSIDSSFIRYNNGTIANEIEKYWNNEERFIRLDIKAYNYLFNYPNYAITKFGIRKSLDNFEIIFNFLIDNFCSRWRER